MKWTVNIAHTIAHIYRYIEMVFKPSKTVGLETKSFIDANKLFIDSFTVF
jgi:hypothetical protein